MVFLLAARRPQQRLGSGEIFVCWQYLIAAFANGLFDNTKQSPHVLAILSAADPFVEHTHVRDDTGDIKLSSRRVEDDGAGTNGRVRNILHAS
jgi:hypothetical protein